MYTDMNGTRLSPETTYTQQGRAPLPRWLCERRTLRGYSNGIGAATLGYIAIALLSTSFITLFVSALLPDVYLRGAQLYAPEYVTQLTTMVSYVISLTIPFFIYAVVIRIPARVALPFRAADPGMTFGGLAVGMALAAIATLSVDLLQRNLSAVGVTITSPEVPVPEEPLAYALYIVLLTVFPAIIEEGVFRGVLMQSLRRFGDGFALIMSSLIFGLYHLNMVQMPFAFLLGLCLGYFTLRTGSLWCAVLIHLFNNSQYALVEYFYSRLSENAAAMIYDSLLIFWLVAGAFALCLLLYRDRNLFMLNPPPCSLPVREKISTFCWTPCMVAALIASAIFTMTYIRFDGLR